MARTARTITVQSGSVIDISSYSADADAINAPVLRGEWNNLAAAIDAIVAGRAIFDGVPPLMPSDPTNALEVATKQYVDNNTPTITRPFVWSVPGTAGLTTQSPTHTPNVDGTITYWQVDVPSLNAPTTGLVTVELRVNDAAVDIINWDLSASREANSTISVAFSADDEIVPWITAAAGFDATFADVAMRVEIQS